MITERLEPGDPQMLDLVAELRNAEDQLDLAHDDYIDAAIYGYNAAREKLNNYIKEVKEDGRGKDLPGYE